jgi:hypothetical protein
MLARGLVSQHKRFPYSGEHANVQPELPADGFSARALRDQLGWHG